MRYKTELLAVSLVFVVAIPAFGQAPEAAKPAEQTPSTQRYANMPEEAVPYRKFSKPYKEWYLTEDTLAYNGAARERTIEEIGESPTVNIGFLGPLQNNPEAPYGQAMLKGAQLALEEANARGGFGGNNRVMGKQYVLKIHDDVAQWGASSTEAVKMAFDEHVVAVLGSIDGASTHIMLRVNLKLEVPIMDTGTTDPTVTETRIPWLIHNFPDDRQQGYALADFIFKQRNLKRIGVIRTQSRYARVGVAKFVDSAKRLGHVPVLEVKFERGDQDFLTQLKMLKNARLDGVVIWGEAGEAGLILKQMRETGMKQPVFGASRMDYSLLLEKAGSAAEGLVTTAALDESRTDAKWQEFAKKFSEKYGMQPDAYAAYAYDGMNMLVAAIEKAGLNRGKDHGCVPRLPGKKLRRGDGPGRIRSYAKQYCPGDNGAGGKREIRALESQKGQRGEGPVRRGRPLMDVRRQSRWNGSRHGLMLVAWVMSAGVSTLLAQTETPAVTPYASMDPGKVDYRGPDREKSRDLKNGEVRIGILLPMQGKRVPEGKLLLQAAQIAIDEENRARPLANGQRLAVVVEDESGPWGQASSAMVRLVMQDEAVALITGIDGNIAHQAEQIANKVGIPVVTLSSDPTTTRINIPWIFRVGPSDREQARAMASEIYGTKGSQRKVLLITEVGHDGRIGGEEFTKAVATLRETPPEHVEINPENFSSSTIEQSVKARGAKVVVLWTGPEIAKQLLPGLHAGGELTAIYLCQKAADFLPWGGTETAKEANAVYFTVGSGIGRGEFGRRYREETGNEPGMAAQLMNEAVKTIAAAVRQAGNNRARVRDQLAASEVGEVTGGVVSFDAAGNVNEEFKLVRVDAGVGAVAAPR